MGLRARYVAMWAWVVQGPGMDRAADWWTTVMKYSDAKGVFVGRVSKGQVGFCELQNRELQSSDASLWGIVVWRVSKG